MDHLRGDEPATALLEGLLDARIPLVSSEIVRFELLAGTSAEDQGVETFFEAFDWVPITEPIARAAAAYARRFRASHSGIDDADYLIAASASLLDAELLTTNVRHFPMFDGLAAPY